jgi:hypothetical protein
METTTTLGADFARALAAKDFDRIRDLLHPEVDFRGLTPRRVWEAGDPDTAIAEILRQWFEDSDDIEALEHLETGAVADRERVFLVEQQLYLEERDGRIGWIRSLCSGFRPI